MGLSAGRRGSYRRRLYRKYRRLRRRHAAGWWQATGPSRAGQRPSQWPFADSQSTLERPGFRQPAWPAADSRTSRQRPSRGASRPGAERARSQRARPRRARRRGGLALSDLPLSVIAAAAVSTVIVVAAAAGAIGVNQWVAAGEAANATTAKPAIPFPASASPAASATGRTMTEPTPESQSEVTRRSRTSQQAQQVATGQPVVVVSQLTPSRDSAWPGLGPDWARPNPRRALVRAMLNGIWPGILQAFLPDPYRPAPHPASCGPAP
jgi:hypothetical protein